MSGKTNIIRLNRLCVVSLARERAKMIELTLLIKPGRIPQCNYSSLPEMMQFGQDWPDCAQKIKFKSTIAALPNLIKMTSLACLMLNERFD